MSQDFFKGFVEESDEGSTEKTSQFYRYQKAGVAWDVIRTGRIRCSRISAFNDPFEGVVRFAELDRASVTESLNSLEEDAEFAAALDEKDPELIVEFRQELSQRRDEFLSWMHDAISQRIRDQEAELLSTRVSSLDDFYRIICMSAEPDPNGDILMWSHYGAEHRGIRVGFQMPSEEKPSWKKVRYSHSPLVVKPLSKEDINHGLSSEPLTYKSTAWEYEREWRIIAPYVFLKGEKLVDGEIVTFDTKIHKRLNRVDFGVHCDPKIVSNVSDLVRRHLPSVSLYQARMKEGLYELEYHPIAEGQELQAKNAPRQL